MAGLTQIINFDNAANFIFDPTKIEIVSDKAKLKLQSASQSFDETFTNDTGFTYDNTKTEFTAGKMRQKNQDTNGGLAWLTFTDNINLNGAGGVPDGTSVGGASVVNNRLNLKGGTNQYVEYVATGNFDSQQEGAVKFKIIPDYSGTPVSTQTAFTILKADNDRKNRLNLTHRFPSGDVVIELRDLNEVVLFSHVAVSGWNPTAGVKYEWEINFNLNDLGGGLGATRVFLDGNNVGGVNTTIGTRDSNIGLLRIGSDFSGTSLSDFEIEDFIYFTTVQHTSNYTPGYTLIENKYVEDIVTIPQNSHIGVGNIISIDGLTATETGNFKYAISIDSGTYQTWNGSTWVDWDNTYINASTLSQMNTNLSSLSANGSNDIDIKIITETGPNQGSIDQLDIPHTGHVGYNTNDNPIEVNSGTSMSALGSIVISPETQPTNTTVGHILIVDSVDTYHNGSAWVNSDGSLIQSNTISEINTNVSSLDLSSGKIVKVKTILNTTDDAVTPDVVSLTINYDFFKAKTDPQKCIIHGYVQTLGLDPATITSMRYFTKKPFKHGDNLYIIEEQVVIAANGEIETSLVETETIGKTIRLEVKYQQDGEEIIKTYKDLTIPNKDSEPLTTVLGTQV